MTPLIRHYPGRELLSAMPLAAAGVMILNDHFLRSSFPGWLTGKLSDVAVVLYFPFLLTSAAGLLLLFVDRARLRRQPETTPFEYRLTRRRLVIAMGVTGAGLAGINLSEFLRDLYVVALETLDVFDAFGSFRYTTDPTDCIALLFLLPVWWWGQRFAVR